MGLTLLFDHFFSLSPALSGFVLTALCYAIGWRELGHPFILASAVSGGGFSLFYAVLERFPRLFPRIGEHPALAAVTGAVFVGVGVGLCVRAGGAPTGDDALAMALSAKLKKKIESIYLASDLAVLFLSLTYIPLRRIVYSLITVVLSGQIIGLFQRLPAPKNKKR